MSWAGGFGTGPRPARGTLRPLVAYQPPDRVLIAIGAAFRAEPILAAEERLRPVLQEDAPALAPFGFGEEEARHLGRAAREVRGMLKDPTLAKKDTGVQMEQVSETMARIRAWLVTLRRIAAVNLTLDAPALERLASAAPEVADSYPRDLLAELDRRLTAAADLKPRLEEVGLTTSFLGRGRKLGRQLQTALGHEDLDPANLGLGLRRYYHRKARLVLLLKRAVRAGELAFTHLETQRARYHLREIEPPALEPPPGAVASDAAADPH